MKTFGTTLTTVFALFLWCSAPALAQQNAPSSDKKIIITKRTVEADGTETTETIVKKGKAAENFDVDKYIKENGGDNVNLNVQVKGGDEDQNITINRLKDKHASHARGYGYTVISGDDNGAFLGVEEDSDEDEDRDGLTVEVVRGSAADKAGLRSNDVILKLDGKPVNQWSDLSKAIRAAKPGDKMQIDYTRNGKAASTEATLTTHKDVKCDPEACKRGFLGIDDDEGEEDEDEAGVRISVVDDSGAEKAGLEDGDVLLQLDDTEIRDWEDITDFMSYTKPGDKIRVTYARAGKKNTVEATLGEQKSYSKSQNWNSKDYNYNFNYNWDPGDFDIKIREKEACLGVYSSSFDKGTAKGTRVSDFTEESAAREANMATGDIITAVNGVRVESHDELWDQIATFKPGDKVKVDFLREEQPRQIEATLKACRDNSNRVLLFDNDEQGQQKVREFTLWNWDNKDQNILRERRVITIHRSEEGDTPKVEAAPAAADRKLELEGFRAYPNPSQGQITVEFHSQPLPTVVSLLDMSGRQLFREELNSFNGDYNQQFDLSEYAKGTIVIHVLQGEKVFTEQVVVN